MTFHRTAVAVLQILLLAGLIIAYAAAGAGLIGLIEAWTVSLIALLGAAVAFVAMVLYFGVSDLELKRRLRRELTIR